MRSSDTLAAIKSAILAGPCPAGTVTQQVIWLNAPASQSPKAYGWDLVRRDDLVRTLASRSLFSRLTTDFLRLIELSELVDTQKADFQQLLDSLIITGVLKSEDVSAINELGRYEVLVSPADSLGLGTVTQGEVEEAMRS